MCITDIFCQSIVLTFLIVFCAMQKILSSYCQMYHAFILLGMDFKSRSENLYLHPWYRTPPRDFFKNLSSFHFLYLDFCYILILVYGVRNIILSSSKWLFSCPNTIYKVHLCLSHLRCHHC